MLIKFGDEVDYIILITCTRGKLTTHEAAVPLLDIPSS